MCGKFLSVNVVCVCVSPVCVLLKLRVVKDAICLVLVVGDATLVLFEAVKKEERSVMHVKTFLSKSKI